jgi:hypothetical protein
MLADSNAAELITAVTATVTALATGAGGLWLGKRKARTEESAARVEESTARADAAQNLVDTALKLLEPYQRQLELQSQSITRLSGRVDLLWVHVGDLERMIREAGLTPPPRPNISST